MKTAVIYARYSSDNQSEQSIEGQLRACQDYAKSHDILILDTYIDRAMTGRNDNRPDFQRMMKDSSKQAWNYVLVYKLDRFSRNKYEIAIHKKTLKDNGIQLVSAMEYIPDSPERIIIESMLEGYAEYYSAELSQKIRRGMKETRLKGFYQGGGLSYGYKLNGRKIIANEDEAEVVQFIFEQYLYGNNVPKIRDMLNEKNILNKGKPFALNTLYDLLKNECYTGIYKFKDEVIDNMYPQIISFELFENVKRLLKKNSYGRTGIKTTYLLKNKLTCGYCGKPISSECGTSKSGKKVNYYKCFGRKKIHNGCKKSIIRKDEFEELILNTITNELSKPSVMNTMIDNLLEVQDLEFKENSNLKNLLKSQKQIQISLANIMNAIERGVINKTTNTRMKELENQLENIEAEILIEKNKNISKLSRESIKEHYLKALELEPSMLINYLIKEIKLTDDEIKIFFNSPIIKSPENNQGFFLFKTLNIYDYTIELFV